MKPEDKAVVQQALEAFKGLYAIVEIAQEDIDCRFAWAEMPDAKESIAALRQLLEQSEQEPDNECNPYDLCAGCRCKFSTEYEPPTQPADHGDELTIAYLDGVHTGKQLAKREWVGLDEDEVEDCAKGCANHAEFYQVIKTKLKEKNT